jgi:Ni,Fe-hydrogenase III large subunit
VRADAAATAAGALARCADAIGAEVQLLRSIYDEHAGVRDRFAAAGVVLPDLAKRLGLIGLAGRASGQDFDLRRDAPCAPYDELAVKAAIKVEGDVAARVAVRFDEVAESIRLVRAICDGLPPGAASVPVGTPAGPGAAAGLVEGWRGPVAVFLDIAPGGAIRRCHPHDPSWQNWPVLEHAIVGNIVPDFPLINKSFNLSYSGHDL